MKRAIAWVRGLKPVRVYKLYASRGGNLSAAGMSFQSLFAAFAAVWVVFAVTAFFVRGNTQRLQGIIDLINAQIPELIKTGGLIDPDVLLSTSTLSITTIVSIVVLGYTAINWLDYTRVAFRRTLGLPVLIDTFLLRKLRDLLLALAYGAAIVVSSTVWFGVTNLWTWLWDVWGNGDHSALTFTLQFLTSVVLVAFDALVLASMIRVLSAVAIPRRQLWRGAFWGAIGIAILKLSGGALLSSAGRNPLLASFVTLIVLLLWFNLIARTYLLTAAWIAVSLDDLGLEPHNAKFLPRRRRATKHRQKSPTKKKESTA